VSGPLLDRVAVRVGHACAVLGLVAALACGGREPFKVLHVPDLVALLRSPERKPTVLDANGADFREREGIIPGAVLLTNYKTYDAAKELPPAKDTPLVFYCADSH
jgi:rhodanese-related sulfurtransferase